MSTYRTKMTLICLPYAGGGGQAYRLLEGYWAGFQVKTLELPGRGSRFGEPLLYSTEALAADAWERIKPWLSGQPYAFLGHSMGSLLAYLLCHKAVQSGTRRPSHVFLSGREGPSVPQTDNDHLLPQDKFRDKLMGYGGINEEIMQNDEAFSFFEPIIRADFRAVETWAYSHRPVLDIPATILAGREDDMTEAEVRAWQKEFSAPASFEFFEGGHFFIFEQAEQFAAVISKHLQPTLGPPQHHL